MPEGRYTVEHIIVQGDSGPEPITVGGTVLVAPFSLASSQGGRSDAEIVASLPDQRDLLAKQMANSVEDVCRIHDVRIHGQYADIDGEVRNVNIAVRNERDYTVSEITRRDPGLRRRYIEMRQCEALAAEMERCERGPLTDTEIQTLEHLAATLEASAPEEEDER